MNFYNDNYWGMHFVWWIIWIAFIIWIFVSPYGRKKAADKHIPFDNQSPLNILKERYARGEITKEAYLDAKKILSAKDHPKTTRDGKNL